MTKHTQKGISITSVGSNTPSYYLLKVVWKTVRTLLMICMTFVILYPLFYMISMAFRPVEDVFNPQIIWVPDSFTIDNIVTTVKTIDYLGLLGNTIFLSVTSTVIQLFITALIGYGFGRFPQRIFRFSLKNVLLILVILTFIVPAQQVAIPTHNLFADIDLFGIIRGGKKIINAVAGLFGADLALDASTGLSLLSKPVLFFILALFGQGIRSGLFILVFMQAFSSMPQELEDAALVDGTGFVRTYFQVMLPNVRTVLIIMGLFSLVWYWNDYYLTSIYLSESTLSTVLANLRAAFERSDMGIGAADIYQMVVMEQSACLLTITPLLLFYLLTQRFFTESIERTGIVG